MLDARTAVRIVCGVFFLPHTICEIAQYRPRIDLVRQGWFPPAATVCSADDGMELVAAFGLIFGLYPRIASIVGGNRAYRRGLRHRPQHGLMWRWQHPGIEYMLFWAVVCLLRRLSSLTEGGR